MSRAAPTVKHFIDSSILPRKLFQYKPRFRYNYNEMADNLQKNNLMTGNSSDWRDASYKESYEKEILGLRRRLDADPSCTVQDLEGILKSLYIMDGADWLGRGEVQSINLSAAIAAHEMIIHELKGIAKPAF